MKQVMHKTQSEAPQRANTLIQKYANQELVNQQQKPNTQRKNPRTGLSRKLPRMRTLTDK